MHCIAVFQFSWLNSPPSQVKVTLRLTVSQSVRTWPDIYYCFTIRSCFFVAPSLTRGRVCLLYMLLALASAVFFGFPRGLATIFTVSDFATSLFVTSYDSQGHGGGIRSRLHTSLNSAGLRWILYPLGTDHARKTQQLYCYVLRTT
jgi:hypothetical protein